MKRPTFLEGAGVALVTSALGGIAFRSLATLFTAGTVARLLIAGIGLLYILYLLRRSSETVGRIAVVSLWLVGTVGVWTLGLSLPLYLAAYLGFIWLVRSLYFHSSLFPAIADLALVAFGVIGAGWAWLETGSLFVSLWCFFLVQALFVAIPGSVGRQSAAMNSGHRADRFQYAYRAAETAIGRLSTTHHS